MFLTGGAGTGKTETIKTYLKRNPDRKVARLATTCAAAQLIGGQTVHSFLQTSRDLHVPGNTQVKTHLRMKVKKFDTLIIEEASMMRIDLLHNMRDVLFGSARGYGDFAGYQVIMVGDFAQLPPVLPDEETQALASLYGEDNLYAFQSRIWKSLKTCELTTIHRQADDLHFAEWLQTMRRGYLPDLEYINQRVHAPAHGAVKLVSTNAMASGINEIEMAKLPGGVYRIQGQVRRDFALRDMRVPETLVMKPGARVILCANNPHAGYVNGSSGTFLHAHRDGENKPQADVMLDSGKQVTVTQHVWESVSFDPNMVVGEGYEPQVEFGRRVRGTYEQLPILPGWAITVHRSQGMSLQSLHVDPRGTFEFGQLYVSLSRATCLSGLTLEAPVVEAMVMCDPRVIEYHNHILRKSAVPEELSIAV